MAALADGPLPKLPRRRPKRRRPRRRGSAAGASRGAPSAAARRPSGPRSPRRGGGGGPRSGRARCRPTPPTAAAAAGRTQLRGSRSAWSSVSESSSAQHESSGGGLLGHRERRLDAARRAAPAARSVAARRRAGLEVLGVDRASLIAVPCGASSSSSCLIARWIRTFVAPSLRPSARAISRLDMPSEKRMISASRRSSGSRSSRPSPRASPPGPRRRARSRAGVDGGSTLSSAAVRPPRAVAVVVGGEVVRDPDQPGAQRPAVRFPPRPLEVAVGLEEGLLGEVLGVVVVADPVVA